MLPLIHYLNQNFPSNILWYSPCVSFLQIMLVRNAELFFCEGFAPKTHPKLPKEHGNSSIKKKPLPPWNSTGKPTFQRQVFSNSESTSIWFSQPIWTNLPQTWMFFLIFSINITKCLNHHSKIIPVEGLRGAFVYPNWSSAEFSTKAHEGHLLLFIIVPHFQGS